MRAMLVVALAFLTTIPSAVAPGPDRFHFEQGNTCVDVYIDPFFAPHAGDCCDDPNGLIILVGRFDWDDGTRPPCQGTVIRVHVSRA